MATRDKEDEDRAFSRQATWPRQKWWRVNGNVSHMLIILSLFIVVSTRLLEEAGIQATGDLTTFPKLGEPAAIANLINQRRERDKPGNLSRSHFGIRFRVSRRLGTVLYSKDGTWMSKSPNCYSNNMEFLNSFELPMPRHLLRVRMETSWQSLPVHFNKIMMQEMEKPCEMR